MKTDKSNVVVVTDKLAQVWKPAIESYIGADSLKNMSRAKQYALVGMVAAAYEGITGHAATEADFSFLDGNNATMAMNVANPVNGGHNQYVAEKGKSGSGDKQFLVGVCIAIAAKTIGLELVQTVPATSQNVTIKHLSVKYNGGDINNAGQQHVHVVTVDFKEIPDADGENALNVGQKYVLGHETEAGKMEFVELIYVGASRKGVRSYNFTVENAFKASVADGKLSDVVIYGTKPALGAIAADGAFYNIEADFSEISKEREVTKVDNTTAIEDYVPNQTTNGLRRTLTRSEADAGTDRMLELDLKSEGYTIGNRVFVGHVSRLQYKRLTEEGYDALAYLTAAMKNEVAQEVNYQIVSAARAYGLSNHMEMVRRGTNLNTLIAPIAVNDKDFAAVPYAAELRDMDGKELPTGAFPKLQNLTKTMQYENIASIGTYLAMVIKQACYLIGVDSRYGEGDAVVLAAGLAAFLEASSTFTKLADKDADMTNATGAKLSGILNGIKVYVDVQIPANCPFVTVLRTNQDVKVDMPGIEGDNILIPGLAYLVKDLISTTELVPEGTGGHKIILDSETDLIAIGDRPQAGYLTFAFDVNLPGLTMNVG